MSRDAQPALELRDLTVAFAQRGRRWLGARQSLEAVREVSLSVAAGEAVGLVGQSGCGKSTLARAAVGLLPATAGAVLVAGRELGDLSGADLRRARRLAQLVFQEPGGSLNPRLTVGAAIGEALAAAAAGDRRARVRALLSEAGLPPDAAEAFPHELSGGQRQRVAIARALAAAPVVLVADEPTSALDVPVQARILNLLARARRERGLALLLISHDLHVVRGVCARVAVMYLGRLVESLPAAAPPRHPYSRALAAAAPRLSAKTAAGPTPAARTGGPAASQEPSSLLFPPSGCPYHPRCPQREPACAAGLPPLAETAPGHLVRCPVVLRNGA